MGEKITYSNCKRWAEVPGVPATSTTEPPPVTVRTYFCLTKSRAVNAKYYRVSL